MSLFNQFSTGSVNRKICDLRKLVTYHESLSTVWDGAPRHFMKSQAVWGHRKTSQKPSKTNKISFTWNLLPPPPPPKRTKVRTSGFNSETEVYTKHHFQPKVRFFRKPPPSQLNCVRFTGLLRTFAKVPYWRFFEHLHLLCLLLSLYLTHNCQGKSWRGSLDANCEILCFSRKLHSLQDFYFTAQLLTGTFFDGRQLLHLPLLNESSPNASKSSLSNYLL